MEFSRDRINQGLTSSHPIYILPEVGSTNDALKQMAADGAPSGTVLLAESQTAGKGRLGRTFVSPPGGFYMSLLLRPPFLKEQQASMLTVYCASITASVLEELSGLPVGIKWVNDLYAGPYKICGILVEAVTDSAASAPSYTIIGIGINLEAESFPSSAGSAGSVRMAGGQVPDKNVLASLLLNRLDGLSDPHQTDCLLDEYRRRSILIGKNVTIVGGDGRKLKVLAIDEHAGLVVTDEDKNVRTLHYGEVSAALCDDSVTK